MPNFNQLLESALFEVVQGTPKASRSNLWQLEQELKKADTRCCMTSGQGERYFGWVRKTARILSQIAKFRPLTDDEKQKVRQAENLPR